MKKPTIDEIFNRKYTEEELEQWVSEFDKVDWICISECYSRILSESFIDKYADKVDWFSISPFAKLSESLIEKHQDKVIWEDISAFQVLSESFIDKFQDKIDWSCLAENLNIEQTLSESFIEKHKDKLDWKWVCCEQKLSENFIRKHEDLVDWFYVFRCQTLSEDFIRDFLFKSSSSVVIVANHQRFSHSFAVEIEMYHCIWEIEQNKKLTEEEKQKIIDTLKLVNALTR